MAKGTLFEKATEVKAVKKIKDESSFNPKFIEILTGKIFLRIRYSGNMVKTEKVKVQGHYFYIDGMVYILIPEAFYGEGKCTYCDYHYGNPRPILHEYDNSGILIPSLTLKRDLAAGKYLDEKGKPISLEKWEGLSRENKFLFEGVTELDSMMLTRMLNQKASEDLWPLPDEKKLSRATIIIIGVLIAAAVTGIIIYSKRGEFAKESSLLLLALWRLQK